MLETKVFMLNTALLSSPHHKIYDWIMQLFFRLKNEARYHSSDIGPVFSVNVLRISKVK